MITFSFPVLVGYYELEINIANRITVIVPTFSRHRYSREHWQVIRRRRPLLW